MGDSIHHGGGVAVARAEGRAAAITSEEVAHLQGVGPAVDEGDQRVRLQERVLSEGDGVELPLQRPDADGRIGAAAAGGVVGRGLDLPDVGPYQGANLDA